MSPAESVAEYASRVRRLVSKANTALSNDFGVKNINTYTPIVTEAGLNSFLRITTWPRNPCCNRKTRNPRDGLWRGPQSSRSRCVLRPILSRLSTKFPTLRVPRPHPSGFPPHNRQGANRKNFRMPGEWLLTNSQFPWRRIESPAHESEEP